MREVENIARRVFIKRAGRINSYEPIFTKKYLRKLMKLSYSVEIKNLLKNIKMDGKMVRRI